LTNGNFLLHEFGVKLMENLLELLVVYLFNPEILRKPHDYCFVRFFTLMIDLRLGSTTVPALNKVDLADDLKKRGEYPKDIECLTARLKLDPSTQGLLAYKLSYKLCKFLPEVSPPTRMLYLSAKTGKGFKDLETVAYEHYCTCGDLP